METELILDCTELKKKPPKKKRAPRNGAKSVEG
jgi:hypothetical protein